ncbi:Neutral alpha-glucosidase AB [Orchesella cincta]|uniref:Glucosidase II subunit alpha n=1 Tax=Orchesella cincta TaxID=48709 RepID=A0A1D2MJ20_ORCCI|nr:Neutral alpha-glucosidase AB [Orchesella cincta]
MSESTRKTGTSLLRWACVPHALVLYLSILSVLFNSCDTVDRSKFRTCDQSGFCKRQRAVKEGYSKYKVDLSNGQVSSDKVTFSVVNPDGGHKYILQIIAYDGVFRVKFNEESPLHPRYEVEHALLPDLKTTSMQVSKGSDSWTLTIGENAVAQVFGDPLRVDLFSQGKKVAVFNGRSTLKFEHLRQKPDVNEEPKEADDSENDVVESSMWEESFGGNTDSKPRGPESIAADIDFPLTQSLYGLPEHADTFMLKDTTNSDPVRLYNLDVFEYELDNVMALYGAIPYVIAHSPEATVGVLWLNAAETWVDVGVSKGGLVDSIVNLVGGSEENKEGRTRWMSESGIIDTFFFMGPKPADVIRQYGKLTGTTPLPQMWAIGSHQCRWNYNDEDDLLSVDANFDKYDIPYDSIWLDIEYTDGKKYFTWDHHKFPHPVEMINNISSKGRKLVTILDPHIKRESGYFLHEDATNQDLYVKDKNGKIYEGWCWPGSSSYLDFFDPKVRQYWASLFALDKFPSTLDTYIWNDMNEPSVFNGPEVTMPKDMMHYGNWEHRDVHNLYGLMHIMSTFEGLLQRSENRLRPFILTRSHYVGAQRYAAVWTGDNKADWGHLKISIPMCLSLSISGMSHCGADIGGFFHNPDAELMLRWYQTAAFQPFMRNHAHIETKRREPWLFGDQITSMIRSVVRKRYALLPYWYTLFYENEKTGMPPMRPLWLQYPDDVNTFPIQDQYLIGKCF